MTRIVVFVLLALLAAAVAPAQDLTCNDGDIAWVTEDVNADVGLAAGAGRCATNTVAGAAYNDPLMPWGIQAAIDCACSGVRIHVLRGGADYNSSTNSWNNRFNAAKEVNILNFGALAKQPAIIGYADTSTSCADSNTPVGCPASLDFSTGGGNGFVSPGGAVIAGLEIRDATLDCVTSNTAQQWSFYGNHVNGCGGDAIDVTGTGPKFIVRNWIYQTGDDAADAGIRSAPTANFSNGPVKIMWNLIEDVAGSGVVFDGGDTNHFYHNIVYSITGDCVVLNTRNVFIEWNTIRTCAGDGIDVGASANTHAATVRFNLITGATGWGINSLSVGGRWALYSAYNVLGNNTAGDINPATDNVAITYSNREGATVVYASASDHTPVSGASWTITFPRGTTTVKVNAGAVVQGGEATGGGAGGGGVFLPGGFR